MPPNNGPRTKLVYDTCHTHFSTHIPNINGEEEVNDAYANRNDHDEGELINIV